MRKFLIWICVLVCVLSLSAFALDVTSAKLTINAPSAMGEDITITGSFTAGSEFAGKGYYVFLARLNSARKFESAEVSEKFVAVEGANSFTAHFPVKAEKQNVRAYLLSEDFSPLCKNVQKSVSAAFLDWDTDSEELYDFILSDNVAKNTDFSKFLLGDDELTVAEGIAMASYLHADYNNEDVNAAINGEFRLDFDGDETQICSLSYHNASGSISDGVITYQPTTSNFDHGLKIEGIELDSKKYNRLTVRMKRDFVANNSSDTTNRVEEIEIFYKTNLDPKYSGSKCIYYRIPKEVNMSDWFEITIELVDAEYTDLITGIRFDSTNNNGVYYVDYITLSQSTSNSTQAWYDKYVDYLTAKGLINVHTFGIDSYDRAITREELYALFVSATSEANYPAINSIKGIPDVKKDDWNADVFLMLYNAGVTLGDANGNFNAEGIVKRSEAAMTYNRILNSSNRLSGSVSANWTSTASAYDLEFTETYSWISPAPYKFTNANDSITNGVLTMTAKTNSSGNYDPYIYFNKNKNVSASSYDKAIVRMKVEDIDTSVEDILAGFFFKTSTNNSWSETLSLHNKLNTYCYKDAAGWYIIEFDLRLQAYWKGTITAIRFDPANQKGTFKLDYIRLIQKEDNLKSHDELVAAGYKPAEFLSDTGFENGFYVCQFEQKNYYEHGLFSYSDTANAPLWQIDPWWCTYDLWENRDTTADKYTLRDTYGVNTVVYNPELESLSMRLDATKIYNGKPHDENYAYWPHLLIEQNTNICAVDKASHTLSSDNKLFAEIDLRMTDFKNTTVAEGENSCLYLIYFYLRTDKAPGHKIWFGLTLFENDANETCGVDWNFDPYSDMMIYRMTTVSTYGDLASSFTPSVGSFAPGNTWKTLRVDLMPEIRRAVEWANRDNIFGTQVSIEDMYIDGVNLGYETRGNFDCTFEIKDFSLVSYEK